MKKHRARKLQTGSIVERSGKFYVRYYNSDWQRVTEWLCDQDKRFKNPECRAVQELLIKKMLIVNKDVRSNTSTVLITEFWKKYLEDVGPTLRKCTLDAYIRVWRLYLQDAFAGRVLSNWQVSDGSGVLTRLAKRGLGSSSISHVRSLSSAVFKYAVNLGLIEKNPWHEVMIVGAKVKDNEEMHATTITEWRAIRTALSSRLDAQCVVDLAFCAGLRPSEIAGLKIEDLRDGRVYIERSVVDGVVNKPKTKKSKRSVAIIEPLKSSIAAWLQACGNPTEGWLIPNSKGGPLSMDALLTGVIRPLCKAASVRFGGPYELRRGFGTINTRASGNLTGARQTMGHSSEVVTGRHYALPDLEAGDRSMFKMEALLNGNFSGTNKIQ